jgi:hypothetical protein
MRNDLPEEMYRNGRPLVNEFDVKEKLYTRFKELDPNGKIPLVSIHINHSVNRERFSEPHWVLYSIYPEQDHFLNWGYGFLTWESLPSQIMPPPPGNVQYDIKVEHDPEECNYSHCEIRVYKNGDFTSRVMNINNRRTKKEYQKAIRDQINVLKGPVT